MLRVLCCLLPQRSDLTGCSLCLPKFAGEELTDAALGADPSADGVHCRILPRAVPLRAVAASWQAMAGTPDEHPHINASVVRKQVIMCVQDGSTTQEAQSAGLSGGEHRP